MRRRTVTLLGAVLGLVGAWALPAAAAPGDPTAPPDEGSGSANLTLGDALEKANREWLAAPGILAAAAKKRQADLAVQIDSMQKELAPVQASVDLIANASYRTGGLRLTAALINTDS